MQRRLQGEKAGELQASEVSEKRWVVVEEEKNKKNRKNKEKEEK